MFIILHNEKCIRDSVSQRVCRDICIFTYIVFPDPKELKYLFLQTNNSPKSATMYNIKKKFGDHSYIEG